MFHRTDEMRLKDGAKALQTLSQSDPTTLQELEKLYSLLMAGAVALQSLDDLGSPTANQQAWDDMLRLQKKGDELRKKIIALKKEALQKQIEKMVTQPGERKKEHRTSDGTWRIICDSDDRWNADGTSEVGGDRPPDEMAAKYEELRKELGDPPGDVRYEY